VLRGRGGLHNRRPGGSAWFYIFAGLAVVDWLLPLPNSSDLGVDRHEMQLA
jgi:hypothetical protein